MSKTVLKNASTVIGFDDGYFEFGKGKETILVGVVYRLDHKLDGILSTKIRIDGLDATQRIAKLVQSSKFKPNIKVLLLSGINFAGFNIVDIKKLCKKTSLPIVIVFRRFPSYEKIFKALKRFKDFKKRKKLILSAGEPKKFEKIHYQFFGLEEKEAQLLIKKTLKNSNLPEPIRLAHLIASGVSRRESTSP